MDEFSVLGQPIVDPNDEGISQLIISATWPFTAVAIVVVAARFFLRQKFLGRLASDDWTMLVALAGQISYQAIITMACIWGMGVRAENITLEEAINSAMYMYVSIPLAIFTSIVSRISITILLIKIFGGTYPRFKIFLIFWLLFTAIMGILGAVLAFVQRSPVESLWNPTIMPTREMDINVERYINLGFGIQLAISDLVCVAFPVAFIWKLNMSLSRKIGLILLMGMSVVAFTAAFVKVVITILVLRGQMPLSFLPDFGGIVFLISAIEAALVIALGCIPTLGPITRLQFPDFTRIGESIASLLTTGRWSRKSSPETSVYAEPLEMGYPKRISDDTSQPFNSTQAVPLTDGSTKSLVPESSIRRTGDFSIHYTTKG